MKHFESIILLFFYSEILRPKKIPTDSLEQLLHTQVEDEKIKTLLLLFDRYKNNNSDKAKDYGMLHRVFQNLIGNAAKYNDISVCIVEINFKDMSAYFQLTIKDNGLGIPSKYHKKIFHFFQTLQPRDKIESRGMGLAIVEKIVKEQGKGRIWIESEVRKGTSFIFTWKK